MASLFSFSEAMDGLSAMDLASMMRAAISSGGEMLGIHLVMAIGALEIAMGELGIDPKWDTTPIADLPGVPTRVLNAVAEDKWIKISSIGDLCRCTRDQLGEIRNVGETSIAQVEEALKVLGLRLCPGRRRHGWPTTTK